MSLLPCTDGNMSLKKVTFARFGDSPEMTITETHGGCCIVQIGELKAVVQPQDLLSAALFVGAKHIDVKLK